MRITNDENLQVDGLREFYSAIRRILCLLVAFYYQWFCAKTPVIKTLPKPKTIAEIEHEYSEKYLMRFLEFVSRPPAFKNANISAVFGDPEALMEILKNPDNDLEKEWRKRILIETTPRGNVYMYYDVYKRAFSYYCDQAVMPYRVINSVAMKYVMTFRCCNFFLDSSVLGTGETATPKETLKPKEPETKPTNAAFVKFKTYNVAEKKAEIKKEEEKTINGFLHLGQVRNFSIIEKPKRTNPLNGFKTDLVPSNAKLSYKDYKSMKK